MDWTRVKTIGRGSFATVSAATARGSDQVFAVKSAELSQSKFLEREQRVLSTLTAPHIVAYKGWDITCENGRLLYNIFMEYAPRGTLVDAIRDQGGGLDEEMIKAYTRNIVLGLDYLHSNGIVHCDIKCRNVLVTSDGVKIADLGCARRIDDDVRSVGLSIAGTPVFMAPEVARGDQQGFLADVWALGCTVIEMATGRAPWADHSNSISVIYRIGYLGDVPEIPTFMSKQAKDFLDKCLKRDPMERWSASELLKHAFLKEYVSLSKEVSYFDLETPTTVLEQSFQDSTGEPETTTNPTQRRSLIRPSERIRPLSGINMTLTQRMPNWIWDGHWIIVRRNNSSKEPEIFNCNQKGNDLLHDKESKTNSGTRTSWVGQEIALVYSNERTRTRGTRACNNSTSTTNDCRDKERGMKKVLLATCGCKKEAFKCKKNIQCGKVPLRKTTTCFLQVQFFLSLITIWAKFIFVNQKNFNLLSYSWSW